jgi:hypothetical protein
MGLLREGSFARGHEVYERKALGMGVSPMGARLNISFGDLERAYLLGIVRYGCRGL